MNLIKKREKASELGTGPRVKWFSQSRSVMFSSYKRVMCNILCLTDILAVLMLDSEPEINIMLSFCPAETL